jgi:hypothetical protein
MSSTNSLRKNIVNTTSKLLGIQPLHEGSIMTNECMRIIITVYIVYISQCRSLGQNYKG